MSCDIRSTEIASSVQHVVCQTSTPSLPTLWACNVQRASLSPVLVLAIPLPSRGSHPPLTGNKNKIKINIHITKKLQT